MLERAREVDQLAVSARNQGFFGQSRRNLARNFRCGGAPRHFASRAIRQSDLNSLHVAICSPVETSSLLAHAKAVKNEDRFNPRLLVRLGSVIVRRTVHRNRITAHMLAFLRAAICELP